jgi:hypothetical protein
VRDVKQLVRTLDLCCVWWRERKNYTRRRIIEERRGRYKKYVGKKGEGDGVGSLR